MLNITDDGLLKANGMFNAAWALTHATPSNPLYKKAFPDSQRSLGAAGSHCLALCCAGISAQQFAIGSNKEALTKTKKDALKIAGVSNLGFAGLCAYHGSKGNMDKEMCIANCAVTVAVGAVNLWQGFKKEKAAVKK